MDLILITLMLLSSFCKTHQAASCIKGCEYDGNIFCVGTQIPGICFDLTCKVEDCNYVWTTNNSINSNCGGCGVTNDPHFLTFDRLYYNWHGTCNYSIVQYLFNDTFYPDFGVFGDFRRCGSASCLDQTTYRANKFTILSMTYSALPSFSVNNNIFNASLNPTVISSNKVNYPLIIWRYNDGIKIQGPTLSILIYSNSIFVWATPAFQHQLGGLCGLYSGFPCDDHTRRDGVIKPLTKDDVSFPNSWLTLSQNDPSCLCNFNFDSTQGNSNCQLCETTSTATTGTTTSTATTRTTTSTATTRTTTPTTTTCITTPTTTTSTTTPTTTTSTTTPTTTTNTTTPTTTTSTTTPTTTTSTTTPTTTTSTTSTQPPTITGTSSSSSTSTSTQPPTITGTSSSSSTSTSTKPTTTAGTSFSPSTSSTSTTSTTSTSTSSTSTPTTSSTSTSTPSTSTPTTSSTSTSTPSTSTPTTSSTSTSTSSTSTPTSSSTSTSIPSTSTPTTSSTSTSTPSTSTTSTSSTSTSTSSTSTTTKLPMTTTSTTTITTTPPTTTTTTTSIITCTDTNNYNSSCQDALRQYQNQLSAEDFQYVMEICNSDLCAIPNEVNIWLRNAQLVAEEVIDIEEHKRPFE